MPPYKQLFLLDGTACADSPFGPSSGYFDGRRCLTTLLCENGRLIDLSRHLDRLLHHSMSLGLTPIPRRELLEFELQGAIEQFTKLDLLKVRLILFQGADNAISRLITVEVLDANQILSAQSTGSALVLVKDATCPRGDHIKTGFIGSRSLGLRNSLAKGFDDVLWTNSDGEVTETTWANVFLIGRTGDLVEIATPSSHSGLLCGITRMRVTELLQTAQIAVTERIITEDEIPRFDEGFLTSSIRGLVPISKIGSHRMHTIRPNSVFHHIKRLYNTWLKIEKD